jgi:hypothetical protein
MEVDFVSSALLTIKKSVLEKLRLFEYYYFPHKGEVDVICKARGLDLKGDSSVISYQRPSAWPMNSKRTSGLLFHESRDFPLSSSSPFSPSGSPISSFIVVPHSLSALSSVGKRVMDSL